MLRAIDARQMKDEIGLLAKFVQLFLRSVDVVLVDIVDLKRGTGAVFMIAKVFERLRQISPHEPLRTGNENVHLFALFMQFGELLPDIGELQELVLDFLHIEKLRVVGVEFAQQVALRVALLEILIVVEAAVVAGNAVEVAEIDGARAFFVGEQRFVHLLAMADADDADVLLPAAKELAHGLGLRLDRAGGCLLYQNIAARAVLEGEEDEIDRLIERHDEARHRGLCDGDEVAVLDLVDPERNDAPPRAHDVAVARAADLRLVRRAGLGDDDLLHHGLGGTHRVDGIGGLVRGEADDRLDALINGSRQNVFRAEDIGLDGLDGEKLTGRHLLQSRRMEYVIDAVHGVAHGPDIAHIADVELDLFGDFGHFCLKFMAHIVLFLLIARKDADLPDVRL